MTSTLFLAFLATMTTFVVALIARYLDGGTALRALVGLCAWFLFAGLMGYFGVIRNPATPGILFIVVPVLSFLIFFIVRLSSNARVALAFPLLILLGAQCFRIGVELFLHQLWTEGLVPRMLTFKGANVDIYIGVSAPLIAWISTRGRMGLPIALAWNVLGLLALTNVVVRAVLTAPGPLNLLHTTVPDRMLSTFPFLFIPGFFVPLGVVLHTLSIRTILARRPAKALTLQKGV